MIIDFKEVGSIIEIIEKLMAERDMNIEEREFVILQLQRRINAARQRTKESDVMERAVKNLPFGLGKIMKSNAKNLEELGGE